MRRAPARRTPRTATTTMSVCPADGQAIAIAVTRERNTGPNFRRSRRMRSSNTSRHSEAVVGYRRHWRRWTASVLVLAVLVVALGGALVWWKFFISERQQFSENPAT